MFNLIRNNRSKLAVLLTVCFCMTVSASPKNAMESGKVYAEFHAENDLFGFSVAACENRILVGALKQDRDTLGADTGAAFMYRLEGGQWQPEAFALPADLKPNDGFGGNVAMHENLAAVNAIGYDGEAEDTGIVFLYQLTDDGWSEAARILAPDAQSGDAFGQSLALDQNTLVVGAPKEDDKGKDAGSVYIFSNTGSEWQFTQKLSAPDGVAGDVFGISVAISGDSILIGADLNDEKANNAGAAYVYTKQGNNWALQAKLMADDGGDTDIFGVRVALDEDTALISARRDDHEKVGKDAGSAYVFMRKGSVWSQQAKLTGPTQQADDRFGRSVALSGNTALIGAMHKDYRGKNAGAAYIFKQEGDEWHHTQTLTASDAKSGDLLGWSASLTASHAIVSAAKHAPQLQRSGAVYIFDVNDN